jgi:purine-binding chemotaxis protein CheW
MADSKPGDMYDDDDEILDEEDDEDSQKDKYLTFRIAEEEYGLEIACVIEIVMAHKVTEVPDMPPYLKGVFNLRGRVIPVVDVRARFKLPARAYDDRTCFVVVEVHDMSVALAVDNVCDVLVIPAAQVSPPPRLGKGPSSRYIKGMGKTGESVKILLDVEKLLLESEIAQIETLQA